jgi:hypothetical protein
LPLQSNPLLFHISFNTFVHLLLRYQRISLYIWGILSSLRAYRFLLLLGPVHKVDHSGSAKTGER